MCYVAFDPVKEEELVESEKTNKPVQVAYKLPDGSTIEVNGLTQRRFIEISTTFSLGWARKIPSPRDSL